MQKSTLLTISLYLICVAFIGLTLVGLRGNNQQMGELKQAVIEADRSGEGVDEALTRLSDHIFQHMNTSTSVALPQTYDREVERALNRSRSNGINPQLYIEADERCNNPNDPGLVRAQCVEDFVSAQAPEGSNPKPVELPLKQAYEYSFEAPRWSLDVAGISLVGAVATGLWALVRSLRNFV